MGEVRRKPLGVGKNVGLWTIEFFRLGGERSLSVWARSISVGGRVLGMQSLGF